MTEDEARQKWCPFVDNDRYDRDLSGTGAERQYMGSGCIASDCMAWRWNEVALEIHRDQEAAVREYTEHPSHEAGGYCGLAGKQ